MDWAGVNIFSQNSQPTAPSKGVRGSRQVELFVEDVTSDGGNFVGLMVGESTPRGTGAQNGTHSWNQWFAPYFTSKPSLFSMRPWQSATSCALPLVDSLGMLQC